MNEEPHHPLPVFKSRLRLLRRAMGVKQFALADMLQVNQATVSRWEAGVQTPPPYLQRRALSALSQPRVADSALRRLVENSGDCVHLVDEATHNCLAYSRRRANDWRRSQHELLGVSLWKFATEEIQRAERDLEHSDWWSVQLPAPRFFRTSGKVYDEIVISPGGILWERLYLSDGTPVRLCTGA